MQPGMLLLLKSKSVVEYKGAIQGYPDVVLVGRFQKGTRQGNVTYQRVSNGQLWVMKKNHIYNAFPADKLLTRSGWVKKPLMCLLDGYELSHQWTQEDCDTRYEKLGYWLRRH